MNTKLSGSLYIFSYGRVAKLNKQNGEIVWEIKLKDLGVTSYNAFGDIRHEGEYLFIGISGHIICLTEKDGSLVWKNDLKGWGYNYISIANDTSNTSEKAGMTAAAVAAATAAV
jgi:outer membrane protein assembly factor BamB